MPLKPEQLPLMTLGELTQAMSGREGDRAPDGEGRNAATADPSPA